jgi:hypothetical protein
MPLQLGEVVHFKNREMRCVVVGKSENASTLVLMSAVTNLAFQITGFAQTELHVVHPDEVVSVGLIEKNVSSHHVLPFFEQAKTATQEKINQLLAQGIIHQ